MKTIVFHGAVYREVSAERLAALQAPKDEVDAKLYALAEKMIFECDKKDSPTRPFCVYTRPNKQGLVGTFFDREEAFKHAYQWLLRKYVGWDWHDK